MTEIVLLFGINAIMVVGFQAFVGNTGLVSFGHVAFMAIGAYATAIVSIGRLDKSIVLKDLPGWLADVHLGVVPSLLVGGGAAAVLALVTGLALMRLSGAAASIATLGLLVITVNVLSQATPVHARAAVDLRRPGQHELLLGLQPRWRSRSCSARCSSGRAPGCGRAPTATTPSRRSRPASRRCAPACCRSSSRRSSPASAAASTRCC